MQLDSEMIAQIRASRLAGDDVIPCICLLCKKPMLERYLKPHLHNVHVGDRTSLPDASKGCWHCNHIATLLLTCAFASDVVLSFEGEHALYGVVNPLLTEKDRSRLDLETVRKIRLSNCSSSRFIRTICLLCKTPYQGVFFDIGKHVRTVHWNQQARSKKRRALTLGEWPPTSNAGLCRPCRSWCPLSEKRSQSIVAFYIEFLYGCAACLCS